MSDIEKDEKQNAGISPLANIFTLASRERAPDGFTDICIYAT